MTAVAAVVDEPRGLTSDEIRTLARAMRAGDFDARQALILACEPLAMRLARAAWCGSGSGMELADMRSEAMLHVVHAVDTYDPDRGPLMPWVRRCVCGRLVRAAVKSLSVLTVPRRVHEESARRRKEGLPCDPLPRQSGDVALLEARGASYEDDE